MEEIYAKLSTPPPVALGRINGGRLNGKTNINPQWRIEAMTEIFGLCGTGWRYEVTDKQIVPGANGEVLVYMLVAVYYKKDGEWSDPVYGFGGDKVIVKEKDGLRSNDEAFKSCLTDALGKALASIGVAASIYFEHPSTKYSDTSWGNEKRESPPQEIPTEGLRANAAAAIGGVNFTDFAMTVFHKAPDLLNDRELESICLRPKPAIELYNKLKNEAAS